MAVFMLVFMLVFRFPTGFFAAGLPAIWGWVYGMNALTSRWQFARAMRDAVSRAGGTIDGEAASGFRPEWVLALMLAPVAYLASEVALFEWSLSPLHRAVSRGDVDEIRRLAGRNPALLEVRERRGYTPLHLAVDERPIVIVALLDCGADINARTADGFTPLHFAILPRADAGAVGMLVSRGAVLNARDHDGRTPLFMAAQYSNEAAVELLVKHGADVDARDSEGNTPLMMVVRNSKCTDVRMAGLLAGLGANVNAVNDRGDTPLEFTARQAGREYGEIHRILKEHEKPQ